MVRRVKSIRGETIDFDLLEIKQKMVSKPSSEDVTKREQYIYSKRRRGAKSAVERVASGTPEVSVTPKPKKQTAPTKPRKRIVKKNSK